VIFKNRFHGPSGASGFLSCVWVLLWLAVSVPISVDAQQSCDPLPPPTGNVIDVYPSGVGTLAATVAAAVSGDTILLHDGTYDLRETVHFTNSGVSMRSANGDRDAVIIDGIIRNNFVAAADSGLFASEYGFDTGISIEEARGTEILHNSVASTTAPAASSIEWRFSNTLVHAANNLVSHLLWTRDGAVVTIESNIESAPLSWFEDVPTGDLHLTALASTPVDGAVDLGGLCDTDLDGDLRGNQPDVGADEVGTAIFADGFESGDTSSWSSTVL